MIKKKCVWMIATVAALSLVVHVVCVKAGDPVAPATPTTSAPSPKDGATDVLRDGTILKWSSSAAKFDVYFGANLQYVTQVERTAPVYVQASLGQTTMTLDPGRLELGKTYYWRVDEVNDVDPNAVKVTKGTVWSFMVEVPALPVANVTATASSVAGDKNPADKTVDASGLSADKHSAEPNDMWLSGVALAEPNDPKDPNSPLKPAPATWIQFQFEKVQRLYSMSIWNWNAKDALDYGVKDVTIESSTNGTDWTAVGDFTLAKGTGEAEYVCNNVINLAGVTATHIKVTVKSGFGASGQYGLSEVKFTAVPVYAREASPASGAKNVTIDGTVSWRSGRDASSHKVYISTDKDAVANGTAPSFSVTTNSFKLSSTELKLGQTHYWRVDEVNEAEDPTSFAGDIWEFSTVDYLVMDDFESFTNNLSSVWGSAVHASLAVDKTVMHSGKQSLVITYDNSGSPDTWISLTGTNKVQKNWTKNGIKALVLFVHGTSANQPVPIRPRINEIAVTRNSVANGPWWSIWSIDSAKFTNVGSITMTFTIPGGSKGKLYIDDLRLYAKVPALTIVDQVLTLNAGGATKGQLDTLIAAAAVDGTLLDLLSGDQTYTLFAPTDDAFAAANINEKSDKALLADVLRSNIVAGKLSVESKGKVKTVEGSSLIQDANTVTDEAAGQAIIAAGADASNGTVLISSTVLMPYPNVKLLDMLTALNAEGDLAGQFDTLLAAIDAAKATVRDTLGKRSYTFFAPTDDAFAALGFDPNTIKTVNQGVLTDVLLYHMTSGRIMSKDLTDKITTVQGGELKQSKKTLTDAIGGKAKITGADLESSNGVIDVVDGVLMPFAKTKVLDLVALVDALNASGDLAGQFSTLIAIAEGADAAKVAPLLQAGAYTVLAPTDAGFAAVGIDAASLQGQSQAFLTDLLLYHVVSGALTAKDIIAAQNVTTVQGGVITLDPNDPNGLLLGAFAGKARITTADIVASNGLVQVIDSGLLPYEIPAIVVPEEPNVPPVLASIIDTITALNAGDRKGEFDTFLAAVQAADPVVLEKLSADAITVFVPTDDACAALGLTAENVAAQDKLVITDVLLYHITAAKLSVADIQAAASITMVKGGAVQQADGVLTDNVGGQAKIVGQDIEASNGMIQIINAVLLPAKL